MGLLGSFARSVGRKSIKTGDTLNALVNYLMITGGVGGAAGGLIGAYGEQAAGGNPNEGAIGGARAGAELGPLAGAGLLAGAATGNPVIGSMGIVPYALNVSSAASEKRHQREDEAAKEEMIRRAIQLQLMQAHNRRF